MPGRLRAFHSCCGRPMSLPSPSGRAYLGTAAALFAWSYLAWVLLTWTLTLEQLAFGAAIAAKHAHV